MADLTGRKILMVIAPDNFRDEEFQEPKDVFESSGAKVIVASKGVKEAKGMLGAQVKIDINLSQVEINDYAAIVFVGGSGSEIYFKDQIAFNLAESAIKQNKVVGAICFAPLILANAGLLEGKKATVFPSKIDELKANNVVYINEPVVRDGNIVTASGPNAAKAFGKAIAEIIQ